MDSMFSFTHANQLIKLDYLPSKDESWKKKGEHKNAYSVQHNKFLIVAGSATNLALTSLSNKKG